MPADDRTGGHIIPSLRGFDPVACGRMRCTQLWAARMITKKRRGRLDRETVRHTDGQRDGQTYKLDWTPLGSFGPQCWDKLGYMAMYPLCI